MDSLKGAFDKIKEDVKFLNNRINNLDSSTKETKESLISVCEILKNMGDINSKITAQNNLIKQQNDKMDGFFDNLNKIVNNMTSTHATNTSTHATNTSTHNSSFSPLNHQNQVISIGNQGVPTDRQTNQQTVRQTDNYANIEQNFNNSNYSNNVGNIQDSSYNSIIEENPIDGAANMLDSLDNLKKELRLKFKRLTDQELLVFSTIYQLDEELGHSDYKILSKRLNLTESSIRDYVGRLIKKGISIEKVKINNKQIRLNISNNLKKVASLSTIIELRGI